MRYPIAIEPGGRNRAWGVVVPDLPGCTSAGDTLDEAIAAAPEAIGLWLEEHLDHVGAPLPPRRIDEHRADRRFDGWIWAVVEVDLSRLSDRAERINITMSRRLLRRVDAHAKRLGETRSGLLARGAIEMLAAAEPAQRRKAPRPARGRR